MTVYIIIRHDGTGKDMAVCHVFINWTSAKICKDSLNNRCKSNAKYEIIEKPVE